MLEHKNKPSLVVTSGFALYMGNPTTEEMVIEAGELFGFNIGNFEQKIVTGSECDQSNWLHLCRYLVFSDK